MIEEPMSSYLSGNLGSKKCRFQESRQSRQKPKENNDVRSPLQTEKK